MQDDGLFNISISQHRNNNNNNNNHDIHDIGGD